MTLTYTFTIETAQALSRAALETATTPGDLASRIVALVLASCDREARQEERGRAFADLIDLRAELFVAGLEEDEGARAGVRGADRPARFQSPTERGKDSDSRHHPPRTGEMFDKECGGTSKEEEQDA